MPRKTTKTDEKPALEAVPDQPQAEEPQQPDGVLVLKIVGPDGDITTDAVPIGNAQATEVATLLELGLAGWRAKIGLDGS